jgi:hypothetical protein
VVSFLRGVDGLRITLYVYTLRDRGPSCAPVVPCHRGTAWRHGIGPRRLNKACRRRLGGPYFRAVGPLAKIVVAKYLTPPAHPRYLYTQTVYHYCRGPTFFAGRLEAAGFPLPTVSFALSALTFPSQIRNIAFLVPNNFRLLRIITAGTTEVGILPCHSRVDSLHSRVTCTIILLSPG